MIPSLYAAIRSYEFLVRARGYTRPELTAGELRDWFAARLASRT